MEESKRSVIAIWLRLFGRTTAGLYFGAIGAFLEGTATARYGRPDARERMLEELDTLDWRREIHDLYLMVRRSSSSRLGWDIWRRGRDGLFREHPASPIVSSACSTFTRIPLFEYDPAFRFAVDCLPVTAVPAEETDLGPDGLIRLRPLFRTAGLEGPLGAELTGYWIEAYGGGVFLPFLDGGSGSHSYQSGRYLLDTIKGADLGCDGDKLILDFNFAYHPSCFYDSRWVCPLPPRTNCLPTVVRAGERLPPPSTLRAAEFGAVAP